MDHYSEPLVTHFSHKRSSTETQFHHKIVYCNYTCATEGSSLRIDLDVDRLNERMLLVDFP